MNSTYEDFSQKSNSKLRYTREEVSRTVIDFASRKAEISQREFARENGVPRTTLQHWIKRSECIDADPALIAFFESPVGVRFLHVMIHALHFDFTKAGRASIHNICNFLEHCGLSRFVAASYGTHQKLSDRMDAMTIKFDSIEHDRLSKEMPEKRITLCEDETFHPQICLVGIEPVSNFIVVERYASERSGQTWNDAVAEGLGNLPVRVLQSTSDEGKGLIHHATKGLAAHHSPDLFHVVYEISKGTSAALASRVRSAEKECERCAESTRKALETRAKHEDFERKLAHARKAEHKAQASLEEARRNQETVRKAKREIGRIYHPYDPLTGEKQSSQTVSRYLEERFDRIRQAADSLSERCKKRIEKAYQVTEKMTATIAFFFYTIASLVEELDVSADKRQVMHGRLIPGFYLQQVAEREKDPNRRAIIRQRSKALLSVLDDKDGLLSDCSDEKVVRLKRAARECAGLFQRSSSCVEGRNAQLALHHHGLHRLSDRKLKALTVIHNYYLKRPDGTTAAERFFESKPIDMFEWLLENMALPPRPRSKRKVAA